MLDFQLATLERAGFIARRDERIVWLRDAPTAADGDAAAALVRRLDRELGLVVDLLEHSVRCYREALSGDTDSIAVLYPEGRPELMEAAAQVMFRRSIGGPACSLLARWVAEQARATDGRPLRVLEVGAGNGFLTRELMAALAALPDAAATITVTDVGRAFVIAAQRAQRAPRPDAVPAATFRVLDISLDPTGQGFEPEDFDVVCGLNVVHATPETARTLGHLRRLVAPGGVVALVESVRQDCWVDMVAGLAEGWWSYADDRLGSPLRTASAWRAQLVAAGLEDPVALPGTVGDPSDCALIMAGRPEPVDGGGLSHREQALVDELRALGSAVEVERMDLRDRDGTLCAVAALRTRLGPVAGLVHASGRIAGATAANLRPDDVDTEMGARVRGLLHVLDALAEETLERVVLCSSLNVISGGTGQMAYVASNAALAGIGEVLREHGVAAHVVHWDRWRATGLGQMFEDRYAALTGHAIGGGIDPSAAAAALGDIVAYDLAECAVSGSPVVAPAWPPGARDAPALAEPPRVDADDNAVFAQRLIAYCRRTLELPELSLSEPLLDAGADSLDVLALQAGLVDTFGVNVYSAALMTEPLSRIADACLMPADGSATLEVVAPEKLGLTLSGGAT